MLQYVTTQGSPFKGNLSPAVVIREGNCLNVFACGICHNVTMLQCHNVTISQCYNVTMLQCYLLHMLQWICYIPTNIHGGNRFWHISCMLQYVTLCHTYILQCSIWALSLELLAKEKGASIPCILCQEVLLCQKSNNLMDVGQSHANGLRLNEWRQK